MLAGLVTRLHAAGCVAAEEEADELVGAAGPDAALLEELVCRRCGGEPLAWVTGRTQFCGERIRVHPGVYVPRPQTELLAGAALAVLAERGTAVDLCTGSGAVAAVLGRRRPAARVVASDVDERAVVCARANGVEAYRCDLAEGLPAALFGQVDVVTAVAPYVPTDALALLPRDARDHEPIGALHGGPDGTEVLRRVIVDAARLLRGGGSLVVELGADQPELLGRPLQRSGFVEIEVLADDEDDVRAVRAVLER